MSEERLKHIEASIDELKKYQSINEKILVELNVSLSNHFKDEIQYDKTIRNLDNSVKNLTLQMERAKLEDYKSITKALNPIYDRIRLVETNMPNTIMNRVRTEATAMVVVSWILISVIGYVFYADYTEHKLDGKDVITAQVFSANEVAEAQMMTNVLNRVKHLESNHHRSDVHSE